MDRGMSGKPIVFRKLKAVGPDEKSFELEMVIGVPFEVGEHEWACPVELKRLYRRLGPVHGIDSLQVLTLALGMVKQLLEGFCEKGRKIYWFDEKEPINISDLLDL